MPEILCTKHISNQFLCEELILLSDLLLEVIASVFSKDEEKEILWNLCEMGF